MTVVIEPIWPWSYLPPFLATATGDVVAALALSGLMAVLLPILWQVRPYGISPRQLVRTGGTLLAMALGWVVIHTWGFTSAPGGRLHGLAMAALVVLPAALLGFSISTYLAAPPPSSPSTSGGGDEGGAPHSRRSWSASAGVSAGGSGDCPTVAGYSGT